MARIDSVIVGLASRQNGFVTRADVLLAGGTDRQIERRVRDGVWQALQAGVYLVAAVPPTWHHRLLGACLSARGLVFASHRAAAYLHEYDGSSPGPLDVVTEVGHRIRPTGAIVHQTERLDPFDCAIVKGIPTTSPMRTLIDYGAVVPAILVERGVESALRRGLVTEAALLRRVEAPARGHRGVAKLRRVLAMRVAGGPAGSYLEVLAAHLDVAGATGLVRQFHVAFPDGEVVSLDWAFPDVLLNLEFDGDEHHRTRRGSKSDLARDKNLRRLSWTVRRFSYADVRERPAWVASEILAMLDRLRDRRPSDVLTP